MIRAVTFDFWNTLYVEDIPVRERRRERRVALAQGYFAAAGRPMESEQIRKAMKVTISWVDSLRNDESRCPDHAEIGSMIAAELGFRLEYDDAKLLAESLSSMGRDHPPAPADGAGVLLSELRGKVKLAIVSDTGVTFGMHLQQAMGTHGLAEFFQCFTWSDQTMTTKPSARQFLHTLHRLDVRPDQAVHVGDLEAADIAGAKGVGMRAIRLAAGDVETAADATAPSLVAVGNILREWGVDL